MTRTTQVSLQSYTCRPISRQFQVTFKGGEFANEGFDIREEVGISDCPKDSICLPRPVILRD